MKQEEKSLETLVNKLVEKQTHVRNAFKELEKRWIVATDQVSDDSLDIIDLCAAGPDVRDGRYCLQARWGLRKYDGEEYACDGETYKVDIDKINMAKLRRCIRKLPTALKEYAEKVEKTTQGCDALLALIPNQRDVN